MKRAHKISALTLLVTAMLGAASAQSTTDKRLNTAPVTMNIGKFDGELSSLLAALAKAAGYELVIDGNIDTRSANTAANSALAYNFTNKPFNEVFPIVIDINGLSYEIFRVGGKDTIRVSNSPIQKVMRLTVAPAEQTATRVKLFFGRPTYNDKKELVDVTLDSPTLRIIADTNSNSLIVRGTNREIGDVERLVADIEANYTRQGPQTDGTANAQRVYTVKSNIEDITGLLAAQYPSLRVTAVGKTGQLVVNGPATQIDAAFALLAQVDKPVVKADGPVIVQRTFTLSNAQATEVKGVLEGTLKTDLTQAAPTVIRQTTDANGNVTSASTQTPAQTPQAAQAAPSENSVAGIGATIIADQRSNSLIVRGTQGQVDQIAELIPLLDKAVPQLNVQVRIQEITETAARNLGIDWTAGFGQFVTKIAAGQISALFDITQPSMGFNIGATLKALESQNLSKSIYEGSVTMQSGQRGRGQSGSTENASAGSSATIKSGGRLELNIPSTSGNISKQIDYGVLIDFLSPQVTADGTITLGVRSNVSALNTPVTGATLPNVLEFANREAQTTISFKTGQTVMLGGLLSTKENEGYQGVPVLSSIPIIGNLFKTQNKSSEKTQLLIVITGNVIQ
ncbi:type II secretion system protein GspD [Deinococcus pimensis]|uniref:type II secretion system protein GspD n=1 Tax=Deinococcus pimensis TaxID=309888 RepID=UPI000481B395|nr:secretin N-terminal domain-containing protein [Deinococcus pimensis]